MNKTWLAHHGILGQKWGIRRFQNEDGSLTSLGKKHVGIGSVKKDGYQKHNKPMGTRSFKREDDGESEKKEMSDRTKKALKTAAIVGAAAVATGLAAYGAYKGSQFLKSEAGKAIRAKGAEEVSRLMAEASASNGTNAFNAFEKRMQALEKSQDTEREAKDVSSSVAKSAKYLIDQRRKKKRS